MSIGRTVRFICLRRYRSLGLIVLAIMGLCLYMVVDLSSQSEYRSMPSVDAAARSDDQSPPHDISDLPLAEPQSSAGDSFDEVSSFVPLDSPVEIISNESAETRIHHNLSRTQVSFIEDRVAALSKRGEIPGLEKLYMYDRTSKEALVAMTKWFYDNAIPTPLFVNRLSVPSSSTDPPKVCISIASSRRQGSTIAYVAQAVVSILARMDYGKYRDSVYVHVFNVDSEPTLHTDIDLIRHLVPVTNLKAPLLGERDGFTGHVGFHENMDYTHIMKSFKTLGCRYPIFLEDDALADENWMELLEVAMNDLANRDERKWYLIKLFVARNEYPSLRGKGITSYDPKFNGVAMLINPLYLGQLAEELEEMVHQAVARKDASIHEPKDIFISTFERKHGLRIESFEPVIFQHTGMFSSLSHRTPTVESAYHWIMHSRTFESDGKAIVFDPNRWALIELEFPLNG